MTIGDRINTIRRENKLSRTKFAEICGVTKDTIYRWESGKFPPGRDKVMIMSEKFGVYVNWIFTGTDTMYKPNTEAEKYILSLIEGLSQPQTMRLEGYINTLKIRERKGGRL